MGDVLTVLAAWLGAAVITAALISVCARTLSGKRPSLSERARRRRRATRSQAVLLAVAVALAASLSRPEDWQPFSLVLLLGALAVASDAVPLTIGRYRFTGGFVAIVLAMALLGPAPAVAIGVVCAGLDAMLTRPPFAYLLNNLAAYATFPLVGGFVLAQIDGAVALAVGCAAVAVAVNLLNFLIIAGHTAMRDGDSLRRAVREAWLPVLEWEVATGAVAALTVYGYTAIGPVVVAGFAISLAILQMLAARLASAADAPPHILKTP